MSKLKKRCIVFGSLAVHLVVLFMLIFVPQFIAKKKDTQRSINIVPSSEVEKLLKPATPVTRPQPSRPKPVQKKIEPPKPKPKPQKRIVQKPKPKPKPKPRKAFVPKKLVKVSDKPQEYRVRHIRVSTVESANLFRKALLDFQNELNSELLEDPDKAFHDREKVEKYFIRIAKKYSTCSTRALGGDLDWIYKGMNVQEEIMTLELINTIIQTEKHAIPEPVKTRLGYHIILVCESRDRIEKEKPKTPLKPRVAPAGTNIPT